MPFQYAVIKPGAAWCVLREEAQVGIYPEFDQALEVAHGLARALAGDGQVELDVQRPTGELSRLTL